MSDGDSATAGTAQSQLDDASLGSSNCSSAGSYGGGAPRQPTARSAPRDAAARGGKSQRRGGPLDAGGGSGAPRSPGGKRSTFKMSGAKDREDRARERSTAKVMEEAQAMDGALYERLLYAAKIGDVDTLRALITSGVDINAHPTLGTALHEAVRWKGEEHGVEEEFHAAAIEFLLENGADPNIVDHRGRTPLHSAALNANSFSIRRLLDAGADPNASVKTKIKS